MSVGPAFAHGGTHHDCDWDGHRWHHDNGDDRDDDGGGRNIGQFIADATTSVWD
jgi:hypothetical protein